MQHKRSLSIANTYWAAHLGCSREELFSEPLRILTHGAELSDYHGVFALFRGSTAVASVPPGHAQSLRGLLAALVSSVSPDALALALRPVGSIVIGPAFIGYTDTVGTPSHSARSLTGEDTSAAAMLRAACSDTEWEHGGSVVGDHSASGVFVGERLVALAGYEVWGGTIAHISVVTHPEFRGRGFGRGAVAHLAAHALAAGLLPQYRTLESNRASMHIAHSLGFVRYTTSLAVRLNRDA